MKLETTERMKEMKDEINVITRWIAYAVYKGQSDVGKFAKAYDKLAGRVYLDHNISITGSNQVDSGRGQGMFNSLSEDELELVLESANNLRKMYTEAMNRKK